MYENTSGLCTETCLISESPKKCTVDTHSIISPCFLLVDALFVSFLFFFFNLCLFGRPEALYAAINKKPTSAAYTVGEGELLAICELDGGETATY